MKKVFLLLFLALPFLAHGQSVTSSALEGSASSQSGDPIAGARITLRHEPTQTVYTSSTDSSGRFRFTGLPVGGPYTLTAVHSGHQSVRREDLTLTLGQTASTDLVMRGEEDPFFELDEFQVIAYEENVRFNENVSGTFTTVDSQTLSTLPTITRSLSDIARLDPRLAVYDRDSGQISAGGKNTRYNSLLIDGVPTNDSFGLSESGLPALKQPFSLEAISEVSVRLSPYSVQNSGFTGASISAVTKSGTNEFSGSVFGFYRNDAMVGDLNEVDSDIEIPFNDFVEYTVGATLGGPIIKDKLFFFALYEKVEETVIQEPADFIPDPEAVDAMVRAAQFFEAPFELGEIRDPDEAVLSDDKLLLKLDWYLSGKHRLSARYNQTLGSDPKFPGAPNTTFDSAWYSIDYTLRDYTVELFSNWSADFSTELRLSYKQQGQERSNNSTLPDISVQSIRSVYDGPLNGPDTSTLTFGVPFLDDLEVDTLLAHFKGSWFLRFHQISFGFQFEENANKHLELSDPYGSWRFERLGIFLDALGADSNGEAADPSGAVGFTQETAAPGQIAAADFKLGMLGFFVEDNWTVSDRLTLNMGIRLDIPMIDRKPPEARRSLDENPQSFEEVFGTSNQNTIDGNYVIQPRVGFNYALDEERRFQLRGGVGVFHGTAPHVWMASTYVDNGQTKLFYLTGSRQDAPPISLDPEANIEWMNENSENQTDAAAVNVNYLSNDFQMPTELKANLALDVRIPNSKIEMTFEGQWGRTIHDIHYVNQNLKPKDTAPFQALLPDGRSLFANDTVGLDPNDRWREPGYREVIELTTTDQGRSYQYTVQIQQPFHEGWAWSIGYTYSRAKTVTDGTSRSAYTNWASNVAFNPNDETLGTSSFETRDRIVGRVTYEHKWSKRHKTRFTVIYDGRSGRPYSYMGELNFDLNGDGNNGNDLLYVPTGLDDPIVSWGIANRFRDTEGVAFMEFVDSTPGLREYKGQVVPRNTGRSPFIHQFDLNITHEILVWKDHRLELIFNIQNFGNLLNEKWGLEKRPRGSYGKFVNVLSQSRFTPGQFFGKGNDIGFYTYRYEELTDRDMYQHPVGLAARWAMQLGLRYSF